MILRLKKRIGFVVFCAHVTWKNIECLNNMQKHNSADATAAFIFLFLDVLEQLAS